MRRGVLLTVLMAATVVLASGVALGLTRQCNTYDSLTGAGVCHGTRKSDTLLGNASPNNMHGKGAADTLKGFGDVDELYGDAGGDRLLGGPGADALVGGSGNDELRGGTESDVYSFGPGKWGRDTIRDATGNGVHFDDVGSDLRITLEPAAVEARTVDGENRVGWSQLAIDHVVVQNPGDDEIFGNASANTIQAFAGGGFDTINGWSGNDEINVADGAGGDVVDCGEHPSDNDTATYDGPTQFSLGDSVTNCETLQPQ